MDNLPNSLQDVGVGVMTDIKTLGTCAECGKEVLCPIRNTDEMKTASDEAGYDSVSAMITRCGIRMMYTCDKHDRPNGRECPGTGERPSSVGK